MVMHVCNPVLGRLRPEHHEFKTSLGYITRHCQQKLEKNMKKMLQTNENRQNYMPQVKSKIFSRAHI
jgi:hypothetical protein